jgi:site-specific recombinase XerC
VDWMLTSGRKRGGKVGTGLGPRSVQLTLSRFRSALDSAVHRRLVEYNVAAPVKCPSQVRTEREPWTAAEVWVFLGSLAGERLQAVMLLSLLGLRPAETCVCAGQTSTSTPAR